MKIHHLKNVHVAQRRVGIAKKRAVTLPPRRVTNVFFSFLRQQVAEKKVLKLLLGKLYLALIFTSYIQVLTSICLNRQSANCQ